MKLLIIEDEPLIAQRLIREAQHYFGAKLSQLSHCEDIEEAQMLMNTVHFDLLLLDLNLSGHDGFNLLQSRQIQNGGSVANFQTIIVSAHTERAVTAFGFGVIDFVPKPFSQERLFVAFERFERVEHFEQLVQRQSADHPAATIVIKKMGNIELLALVDIDHIQADGHYSNIVCCDGQQHFYEKSLEQLLRSLPTHFLRIHRSYILNMHHFKRLSIGAGGKYSVDTRFTNEIPVSRAMYPKMKEILGAT
ncbi:MAG: LytTR family DNA-binding domain-containing protein [Undibacterium sp.]|nr:LytTR family DNA-binding domain-containing protein [Undibacterium sp.]